MVNYLNLTEEQKSFHYFVYIAVSKIPYGKVTNYGHIAYLIGKPANSRHVGSSLKYTNIIFPQLDMGLLTQESLPWWRVIGSSGKISPRENYNAVIEQRHCLEAEGVVVNVKGTTNSVDLEEYGWFPEEIDI